MSIWIILLLLLPTLWGIGVIVYVLIGWFQIDWGNQVIPAPMQVMFLVITAIVWPYVAYDYFRRPSDYD